jgi:hypothetical protein
MRMRVRRELQALACNVTAELQTVIGIVETTNHRLQVVEAQNTQLRVHIGNLSSTVALQLQQQCAHDRQRTDTVLETTTLNRTASRRARISTKHRLISSKLVLLCLFHLSVAFNFHPTNLNQ